LERNANVRSYSDAQIIQRYALARIYYSTFAVSTPATGAFLGPGLTPDGWHNTSGWLSDDEECSWFGVAYDENGAVESIMLVSSLILLFVLLLDSLFVDEFHLRSLDFCD
jgi:hypothetical protein